MPKAVLKPKGDFVSFSQLGFAKLRLARQFVFISDYEQCGFAGCLNLQEWANAHRYMTARHRYSGLRYCASMKSRRYLSRYFQLTRCCSQDYIDEVSPKEIKRIIKTYGLTQQALADKIGAHRVTIADWVRGANKPKGLYLKALQDLAEKQMKPNARGRRRTRKKGAGR